VPDLDPADGPVADGFRCRELPLHSCLLPARPDMTKCWLVVRVLF